jgi:hypothetical protein
MKRLIMFLLCQISLDGFGQDLPRSEYTLEVKPGMVTGFVLHPAEPHRTDTLRADLLITRCRLCMAHDYAGYIVKKGYKVVSYLDNKKQPFKRPVKVWLVKEVEQ